MSRDRPGSPVQSDRRATRVTADPLGKAMLAHQRDEPGRLVYRDGADVQDGNVAAFYFSTPESWGPETVECLERLADREPILDVGCGAGKHLLWWADRDVEAVGVDASPNAIRAARERGLEEGRLFVGDMFDLPIETGAVGAVHAVGTQIGLGRSLAGIRTVLAEFARVTADDGRAVVDNYDPTRLDDGFFGYRSDPRTGIAHRCFHLEFERETPDGDRRRELGRTLQFLLCSPARLREATIGTPWCVTATRRANGDAYYRAVLERR
ncbi:class I SAM-dependent methyltransferase [Halopiger djelfimassiliensis]|uniref:class I SAM-dependent methyltransferase n=1 Tax=Halopiger djelfimassiliensis TaxID=1293047 RepID=UPI000677DE7C|nr:class I SAM-dependent methyltransferase [Halopiger djelfimassiliensis]